MRILIIALLVLAAPMALADNHDASPLAWHAASSQRAAMRQLNGDARELDAAAARLHFEVRANHGRTQLGARAAELARASRDFRRMVERGARVARLDAGLQRVAREHALLARQLHWRDGGHRPHRGYASLREVDKAVFRTSQSLQRYAWSLRDRRGESHHVVLARKSWPR